MMRAAASSFLLVMAAITAPGPAYAHGGKLQLARAPAGPYAVSAWTQPNPPRVGRLDVSVVVLRPDTGEPMEHVEARVTARHVQSSQSVSAAVGPDTSVFSWGSASTRRSCTACRYFAWRCVALVKASARRAGGIAGVWTRYSWTS